MNILQMSVSATVIILMIVLIRALAIHKLPKKTFVALWCVTVFRLLVPLSLPSQFSVYSVANKVMEIFTIAPAMQAIVTGTPSISITPSRDIGAISPTPPDGATQMLPMMVIWIAGIIVCALFFLVSHMRRHREYKAALPLENDYVRLWLQKQKLRRSIQVLYSDRINAPVTYGVLNPVILFPKMTDWQDEAKLRYILTHELTHIKRFDILLKWLLTAAVCIHWFNPFIWVMYIIANHDIEMSCDEAVVWALGETEKSAYALTLIELEERKSGFAPLCNNFAKNAIEERIKAIMKIKKSSLLNIAIAIALVSVLTVGVLTVSTTAKDAVQTDITSSTQDLPLEIPQTKENTNDVIPNDPPLSHGTSLESPTITTDDSESDYYAAIFAFETRDEILIRFPEIRPEVLDIVFSKHNEQYWRLLSVSHDDERTFSAGDWKAILEAIELGLVYWED